MPKINLKKIPGKFGFDDPAPFKTIYKNYGAVWQLGDQAEDDSIIELSAAHNPKKNTLEIEIVTSNKYGGGGRREIQFTKVENQETARKIIHSIMKNIDEFVSYY